MRAGGSMRTDELVRLAAALCAQRGAPGEARAFRLLPDGSLIVVSACGRKLRFAAEAVQAQRRRLERRKRRAAT